MDWMREVDRRAGYDDYYTRKKLSNGMTAYVSLISDVPKMDSRQYFYVALVIAKKRKAIARTDYFDDRMTGDGSLEGLIFAKQAIANFEASWAGPRNIALVVGGSDSRRQKLYERYFPRMGFVKERRDGAMLMIKRIDT